MMVSETSGTVQLDVPSVENCAVFMWTESGECRRYDTKDHYWKVMNHCPRAVRVQWADNAYDKPVGYGDETGKPLSEKLQSIEPGETLERNVSCVDQAELAICIEYIYPPLKEHDVVDCGDFFD